MKPLHADARTISGSIRLSRVGWLRFPHYELTAEGRLVAELARDSSMWIFFGRGRRIRLADGTEWRVKAATSGRLIVPVIRSPEGTVAFSGPLHSKRSYGITGKDFAYDVIPPGRVGLRGTGVWGLRRHERDIALIDVQRRAIDAAEPIPIAAALMAFTVLAHGTPGDADLMPSRD
jgi:hypothetical protein